MAKTRTQAAPKKTAKKAPARKKSAAKKAPAKKTTRKKVAKKSPARKKVAAKKTTAKKASSKKVAKKKVAKKKVAKKSPAKKVTKKKVAKKTTAKKTPPKKKTTTKKKVTKKVVKKVAAKPAPPKKVVPVALEDMTIEQRMELDWTEAKLRRVKSGLSRKDLAEYRAQLLEKRVEIVGDVQGMERSRSASLEDISHMPLHMADVGTDTFEQEFTLGLIESERRLLTEINGALHRMQDKTYGVCMASGTPIGKARLEFKPWAKYCIEVARLREKRGL